MTVRRNALALMMIWAAVFFLTGCGGNDGTPLAAETDESLYLQGLQFKRQGRHQEALVSFLKVIEKRGEQASAESHFEVGLIYLTNQKDYLEAIHHFRKYLEQKPNSPQAAGVRDLVNTAKREFLRSLPARPTDEFAVRPEHTAEIEELRRQNAELRAEIATWRGGAAAPVNRAPRPIAINDGSRGATPPPTTNDSPISIPPSRREPASSSQFLQAPPSTVAPTNRNVAAKPPASAPPSATGRRYRVAAGDSLFSIARKFDPTNAGKKVREIAEANPDIFPNGNVNTPLRLGTELRIP